MSERIAWVDLRTRGKRWRGVDAMAVSVEEGRTGCFFDVYVSSVSFW